MRRFLSLALMALLVLAACARSEEGVRVLRYASPYGPGHPFSRADQVWMDYVEAESEGRIRIRPFWSGSLISETQSMVEIRHGVADIGLITPIYTLGGAHLLRTQSGFYSGVKDFQGQLALFRCMEQAGDPFAEELEGLKVLAVQGGVNPGLLMRDKTVRTLDDLDGLRIRAPTELLSTLKAFGADPVEMPMGEVYSALAKGMIDGVAAPSDTFASLHFQEVTQYYTEIVFPRGAYPARAMSEETWRSLSPEDQALFERSRAVWEGALDDLTRSAAERGRVSAAEHGVTFVAFDEGEQAALDALYLQNAEKAAMRLSRFGIDAMPVFQTSRASVQDGVVDCKEPQT